MLLYARPASMKRGERVVTIVGRDAMDARVPSDEWHKRVRQKRVVLAPLGWCQVLRDRDVGPIGPDALSFARGR
jgi:hypothetical protein